MSEIAPSIEALRQDLKGHRSPPSYRIEYRGSILSPPKERALLCECGNRSRNYVAYERHVAPFLKAVFWVNYLGLDMEEMCKP